MTIPHIEKLQGHRDGRLDFALTGGGRLSLFVLEPDMVRVLLLPDGKPRLDRTWSIAPGDHDVPWQGRSRLDISGFSMPEFALEQENGLTRIRTTALQVEVQQRPLRLVWATPAADGAAPVRFAADRPARPYRLGGSGTIAHALVRHRDDRFYGLGEKTGPLDRRGRRFRMQGMDALGYDAAGSDPLYKTIPFTITCDGSTGLAYGLFYDNLAASVFDLGCEIDNYLGPYRTFEVEGGDLDYYLMMGPRVRDVVRRFAALTGRMALGPKWSLGFCASTMSYTETDTAAADIQAFAEECRVREVPCEVFQLCSGYSSIDDRRHVFHWNPRRFPDPEGFAGALAQAGLKLAANVKPCLLTDNPRHDEAREKGLFVRRHGNGAPMESGFWGGTGSYLDFTNADTVAWWKKQVKSELLEKGIAATWNDNNEFEVWDRDAVCDGFGETIPTRFVRPLLGQLMTRASREAQSEHSPDMRPHVLSRAACPGTQRYAQTWTGDNETSWKTLKYNTRMGLGLGLSGLFNVGHDVGGFVGPPPDPELLVRWVQNGLFHPRFTMHSWNDDGSASLPWMHEEVAGIVRDAIQFRYHLMPYLYTLHHRAHRDHEPIIRPTFYDFDEDPQTFEENDDFMLGDQLLVASVVEQGATERAVYLPKGPDGWVDIFHGTWHGSGKTITVPAPLDVVPLLAPDGAILPLSTAPRPVTAAEDTGRMLWVFPHRREGETTFRLYEDDGVTTAHRRGHSCEIEIVMESTAEEVRFFAHREGVFEPAFTDFNIVLPSYERRKIRLNGWPVDRVTEPLTLTF